MKEIIATEVEGLLLLWKLFNDVRHLIHKAHVQELKQYGLTARSFGIIYSILKLDGKATMKILSEHLLLESNSISEQLSRMERDGLISKEKDKGGKGVMQIEVTDKGYEIYQKIEKLKAISYGMSILNREEQLYMWNILAKMREHMMKKSEIDEETIFPPANPIGLI